MRASLLIGVCLGSFLASTARGDEEFPYEVTATAAVEVRSGPGDNSYVTDTLPAGAKVEVYRREAGGWLGIRPPEGSFSWVRRDSLGATGNPQVGKVLADETVCRVGSKTREVRDHAGQVYLREGELVELLDSLQVDTQTAKDLEREGWCRIAPPSGEFRWVRAADLQQAGAGIPSSPSPATRPAESPASPPAEPAAVRPNESQSPAPAEPAAILTPPLIPQPLAPAAEDSSPAAPAVAPPEPPETSSAPLAVPDEPPAPSPATSIPIEPAPRVPREPPAPAPAPPPAAPPPARTAEIVKIQADDQPAYPIREVPPVAEAPAPASADTAAGQEVPPGWTPRRGVSTDDLIAIGAELDRMVSREIRTWRPNWLRQQVEALLPKLGSDAERAQARQLLDRIAEFEELQNHFAAAGEAAPDQPLPLTGIAPGPHTSLPTLVEAARYDGSGWLVPVHSSQRVAPPFALLDDRGDVLQYVAPVPGLNLSRYVRKQVGIYGQRSTSPSLNKPLLAAERVIDLSRQRR